MRARTPGLGPLLAAATLIGVACGSLNSGEIVIVDGHGGAGNGGSGGANPSSGGSAGRSGGSNGMAGEGGAPGGGDGGDGPMAGAGGVTTGGAGPGTGGAGPGTGGAGPGTGGAGTGGTDPGTGGSGDAGASGAGGVGGGGCATSAECPVATPICEPITGACVRCLTNAECKAANASLPVCATTTGRCVGCLTNTDCVAATPICGTNSRCRVCAEGSECSTLACEAKGSCAATGQVVYALAETGFNTMDCGTQARPCSSLSVAASKLTSARPHLVLMPTAGKFSEGAALPANLNLFVTGNHVLVAPYSDVSAFVVSGGSVSFNDVVVRGTGTTALNPGIACTDASFKFHKGSVANYGDLSRQYHTAGILLSNCNAEITQATFTSNAAGVKSDCTSAGCVPTQSIMIERSLFEANVAAIYFDGATALIRNNLIIKNGNVSYARIVELAQTATTGIFAYNTLWGNENNCSYTGMIDCGSATGCGTLSSNITWANLLLPTPCPTQVYYPSTGMTMTNSLGETTYAGANNISADPRFTNTATKDFSLAVSSPAVDKGSTVTSIMPTVDYFGNARPRGAGPDMGAIESR